MSWATHRHISPCRVSMVCMVQRLRPTALSPILMLGAARRVYSPHRFCIEAERLASLHAEDTHPAIIDMATFEAAQVILKKVAATHDGQLKPQKSEFTGRILCPFCDRSYKRMTSNGSVGWNCTTYLTQGKEACHCKKIPEVTLKAVCAEVLDIPVYEPAVFTERIEHIEVPQDNHLRFFFKDGRVDERTWADRSRRESWTPQMKAQAAQRTRKQRREQSCQE